MNNSLNLGQECIFVFAFAKVFYFSIKLWFMVKEFIGSFRLVNRHDEYLISLF